MQQAGVIASDYATLMVEIMADNTSSKAGEVYGALDMPSPCWSARWPRHTAIFDSRFSFA
jgi:hypothetical protein